jgi:hypothetical protein
MEEVDHRLQREGKRERERRVSSAHLTKYVVHVSRLVTSVGTEHFVTPKKRSIFS